MSEAELYEHFCGGYRCDNPGVVEVVDARSQGFFGWLCQDCADDLEQQFGNNALINRQRIQPGWAVD